MTRLASRTGRLAPAVALALVVAACSGASPSGPPASSGGRAPIRIASFNFPESVLLAQLYGQALTDRGFPVALTLGLGSREIVEPALQQGFVDLVPEYGGSALDFVTLGNDHATADPAATHDRLVQVLGSRGVAVLDPAPAQDQNAIAVTASTARAHHLLTVDDLAPLAPGLVFGGPPECAERPLCLPGLEHTYGLRFGQFMALDASGPYAVNALKDGTVDVALLFTTDGAIAPNGFVVLRDSRHLQPAENVTPVLRRSVVQAYGDRVVATLNAVSAQLTTADLATMNEQVSLDRRQPADVARDWLREHGLVG
jgi:osmoprotectant transport system substrate-binding protein